MKCQQDKEKQESLPCSSTLTQTIIIQVILKRYLLLHTSVCALLFTEFERQVMRQLVTLNARSEEHTKYLDIMVMVNDLKEKMQLILPQGNPLLNNISNEVEYIIAKFPGTDENSLKEVTDLNKNSAFYNQVVSNHLTINTFIYNNIISEHNKLKL